MELVKIRSYWIQVGLQSNMTGVLVRRKDTHTQRRRSYVNKDTEGPSGYRMTGRDWRDIATSPEMLTVASSPQKPAELRKDPALEPFEGARPWRLLDAGLLVSRTVRINLLSEATQSVVLGYSDHRKLIRGVPHSPSFRPARLLFPPQALSITF